MIRLRSYNGEYGQTKISARGQGQSRWDSENDLCSCVKDELGTAKLFSSVLGRVIASEVSTNTETLNLSRSERRLFGLSRNSSSCAQESRKATHSILKPTSSCDDFKRAVIRPGTWKWSGKGPCGHARHVAWVRNQVYFVIGLKAK